MAQTFGATRMGAFPPSSSGGAIGSGANTATAAINADEDDFHHLKRKRDELEVEERVEQLVEQGAAKKKELKKQTKVVAF